MKAKIILSALVILLIFTGCTAIKRSFHYAEPTFYSYPCTEHDSCDVYNLIIHLNYKN